MFYFSGTDVEVAGASPETLVKLDKGILHTFPLAGTRPRGITDEEDKALEKELLADEKELAEHNMLVDLGRNDLGKISKFGTVTVEKLHSIERYSHVMHIGSTVRGEISPVFPKKHLWQDIIPSRQSAKQSLTVSKLPLLQMTVKSWLSGTDNTRYTEFSSIPSPS